mmetsp:Transcript_118351/g.342141  ORF Transcript_118351/g.342141 Transcript_118351/m.342141 type:complete len:281 (-) Transcript_118351:398-1240(-)
MAMPTSALLGQQKPNSGSRTPDFFWRPPTSFVDDLEALSLVRPGDETPKDAELQAHMAEAILQQVRGKLQALHGGTEADSPEVGAVASLDDVRKVPLPSWVAPSLPPPPGLPAPPLARPCEPVGSHAPQARDLRGFSAGDGAFGGPVPPPPEPMVPRIPRLAAASMFVVSMGSVGHPTRCGVACEWGEACTLGSACPSCHLCRPERERVGEGGQEVTSATELHGEAFPSESVGSIGHPWNCAEACKFSNKPRGCKDGMDCVRCHKCVWRRCQTKKPSGRP